MQSQHDIAITAVIPTSLATFRVYSSMKGNSTKKDFYLIYPTTNLVILTLKKTERVKGTLPKDKSWRGGGGDVMVDCIWNPWTTVCEWEKNKSQCQG